MSTTFYRWRDVAAEVGKPALLIFNFGFIGGMVFGVTLAQAVSPVAGVGVGFGLFFASLAVALFIAKAPDAKAPKLWNKSSCTAKAWHLAFYSVCISRSSLRHPSNKLGKSTPSRPQSNRGTRHELEYPRLLGPLGPLCLCTDPRHRLQLLVSCLLQTQKRPVAHCWFWCRPYRTSHHLYWFHCATMVQRLDSAQQKGRGQARLWNQRFTSLER